MSVDVDALKQRHALLEVLGRYGVTPDRLGHSPCPKCGGDDRFYVHPYRAPECCACRRCHEETMDVIGLVEWMEGCSFQEAVAKLDGKTIEQRPAVASTANPKPASTEKKAMSFEEALKRVESVYYYRDVDGKERFAHLKYRRPDGRKDMPWYHMNGRGWESGHGDYPRILFNAARVREAIEKGQTIWLHEGEKGAQRMTEECPDECSTTHGFASKTWTAEFSEQLRGAKRVIIVADRDEPGESWARMVATSLLGVVGRVVAVSSKTSGEHDDAFDHFEAGYTIKQFISRPDLVEAPACVRALHRFDDSFVPAAYEFLWDPYVPRGFITLVESDGGMGKTSLCLAIAAALSQGFEPGGTGRPAAHAKTLYLGHSEDEPEQMHTVYRACGGRHEDIAYDDSGLVLNHDGLETLSTLIRATDSSFVILDGVFDFFAGVIRDIRDPIMVAKAMKDLAVLAGDEHVAIACVRHTGKSAMGKSEEHMGIGSVMFRNKARSQLALTWHPDKVGHRGVVIAKDSRGSILREQAAPFAFQRRGNEVLWVSLTDADMEALDMPKTGRKPNVSAEAAYDWLVDTLKGGPVNSTNIMAEAKAFGIGDKMLKQVKAQAGAISRRISDVWFWELPEDPFADD